MSWIQTRRRAQEAPAGRPMEDTLRRQMAWAAGTEQFQHRDPLYHVTESFQQTFDAIGRRHAQELAGGRTEEGAEERADQTSGENQMPDQTSPSMSAPGRRTRTWSGASLRPPFSGAPSPVRCWRGRGRR